jgi:hypothetical protein
MTEHEIANHILNAMALREGSYKVATASRIGWYGKTIQECFDQVFNNSALGKLYALSAISCWNETETWCRDVLKCEALKY